MQQHVRIAGWLFIAYSIFLDVVAIFIGIVVVGGGALSGDRQAMMITGAVAIFVVALLLVLSIPGIITGMGLLKFRPWARILAIILAVLNILSFPLGTALAIYTLWAMLSAETGPLFGGPPPPPRPFVTS